ncbi:XdhC family protein [Rhizobium lentis]|uniref:XdhC family protein n=2 Tax=Rhizobium lentis TaxID=1138194 RepID=A0ABS7IFV6_9HYPH|nr:XdhC family protein [Rhizobium lentis]MBX5088334.1 XdhC family protein [Rhizobium lentis]
MRAPFRAFESDNPADILRFAVDAHGEGGVALAILTDIRGGASRSLGSYMAIAKDGRYCGYVSGGCVEAAVASEALKAIRDGRDRVVLFGNGSPFFDLVLPCGGGITVTIHVVKEAAAIKLALKRLSIREAAVLCYDSVNKCLYCSSHRRRAGWNADLFSTIFTPATRLIISGNSLETHAVQRVAGAAGFDVLLDQDAPAKILDRYCAVVLLHHDLDREENLLRVALRSDAFYIGALGSIRTHRQREARLAGEFASDAIARIKAPVGIFGPTRDATTLALSVIADVAASRLALFG